MNNFIAAISGIAVLFTSTPETEPMSYESIDDYCFWRLQMYDHF